MRITKRKLTRIIKEELSRIVEQQSDLKYKGWDTRSPGVDQLANLRQQFRSLGFEVEDRGTRETTGSPILYIFGPPEGWEWYFMGPSQGRPNFQVTIGKFSEPCGWDRSGEQDWSEVRAECFDSNARALVDKVASLISQMGFQAKPYDRDTHVDPNSQLAIFYGASIEGTPEPNREGVLMKIFAAGGNMATNARISFELI